MISKGLVHLAKSFLEGTWSLRLLVLSQTLYSTFHKFMGSFGFLPCILNLVELLLNSWKKGLSEGWVGSWFISVMSTMTITTGPFMPTYSQGFFQSGMETWHV